MPENHRTARFSPPSPLTVNGLDWSWAYVVYRPIDGYPGYVVGSDGTVWSRWTKNKRGSYIGDRWRQVGGSLQETGYYMARLKGPDGLKSFLVHGLVLTAFYGPKPFPGAVCRHFPDPDRTNNDIRNIRWGTYKQNSADRVIHGTTRVGSEHGCAKLADADIPVIRKRVEGGESYTAVGASYGVLCSTIADIAQGRRWTNLTGGVPVSAPKYTSKGTDRPAAKLTEGDIPAIRRLIASGMNNTAIGRLYGVDHAVIRAVKTGRCWSHVPG